MALVSSSMRAFHDPLANDARDISDRFKAGQAYSRLRSVLVAQQAPSHSKLDPAILSERLGISRTPVREALIHLSIEQIILNIPGSGFFTRTLDADELLDDYDMALTILRQIIKVVMQTETGRPILLPDGPNRDATCGQEQAGDDEALLNFIEELYDGVARSAGNRRYLQYIQFFIDRTSYLRLWDIQHADRRGLIATRMTDLKSRLASGDTTAAIANLEMQFSEKMRLIPAMIRERNRQRAQAGDTWLEHLHR